jgi:hypothetical protein
VVGDGGPNLRSALIAGRLAEAMLKEQIIPADDGILDETVAGLGDLLLLIVSGAVSRGYRAKSVVGDVIDHLGRTAFYRYFPPERIREPRNQA